MRSTIWNRRDDRATIKSSQLNPYLLFPLIWSTLKSAAERITIIVIKWWTTKETDIFSQCQACERNGRLRMSAQAHFCEAELYFMKNAKLCSFLCFVIAQFCFASIPAWWSLVVVNVLTQVHCKPGKVQLFGNLGHKFDDGILSQGLVLVTTLCRLSELF